MQWTFLFLPFLLASCSRARGELRAKGATESTGGRSPDPWRLVECPAPTDPQCAVPGTRNQPLC